MLIISQFEANELLRDIQDPFSGVRLHVFEPRVTKSMGSVDFGMEQWQSLDSGSRRELNLFAGQLYFNEFEDYTELCKEIGSMANSSVERNLSFIRAWTAIRRKGQDFSQTHVGRMVNGRSINVTAFE